MPYELPPDPSTERRVPVSRAGSASRSRPLLVALVAYFGYVGFEGSRQLTDAPAPSADCRTPATLGWAYEAINYDIATDARSGARARSGRLQRSRARRPATPCTAGDVGLAGWYIPAGNGAGPTAPTVVMAHGWGSNKSDMLDRAAILHDTYNLLLFDFRNHGQSGAAATTQGVREADDLRAMLDWLEAQRRRARSPCFGSIDGRRDARWPRRTATSGSTRSSSSRPTRRWRTPPRRGSSGPAIRWPCPASWAILLGALIRTGEDVSSVDPIQSVEDLDDRPLLLVYGGADLSIGPTDAEELAAAATEAGSPTELHVCADAGHASRSSTARRSTPTGC